MDGCVIEARDLEKVFARKTIALSGLNMNVPSGSVYGLIGRNGAGKTTALRCLMGALQPTRGRATVLGADLRNAPIELRARVAYVPQTQQMHGWMSLGETCEYVAHFYPTWDDAYARTLAKRFELPWDRTVGSLSGGEQRKAATLVAFASRTEVLVLDEPAAGLDPVARRQLIDEIIDALAEGDGHTVLLSSHILSDLERIADRVGIMDNGRMLREAVLEDLRGHLRRVQIIFEDSGPPPGFSIPGTLRQTVEGPVLTALVELPGEDALETLRQQSGLRITEFPVALEDLFIELLGSREDAA